MAGGDDVGLFVSPVFRDWYEMLGRTLEIVCDPGRNIRMLEHFSGMSEPHWGLAIKTPTLLYFEGQPT
jgi:hypothetical protein